MSSALVSPKRDPAHMLHDSCVMLTTSGTWGHLEGGFQKRAPNSDSINGVDAQRVFPKSVLGVTAATTLSVLGEERRDLI